MRKLARLIWLNRSQFLSYVVAALGVAVAVIAALLLETYLQSSPIVLLFLCAIMFAAWFGGGAAGLTAAGFGAGSALTVLPIQAIIKTSGYETAFLYFGIAQGLIVLLVSFGLAAPDASDMKARDTNVAQSQRNYRPAEVLRTPVFWVMYHMSASVYAAIASSRSSVQPRFGLEKEPHSTTARGFAVRVSDAYELAFIWLKA